MRFIPSPRPRLLADAIQGRASGAALLLALTLAMMSATAGQPVRAATPDAAGCATYGNLDEPLYLASDGRSLTLRPLPAWRMPLDPTWREDPFDNTAWLVRYQSLRYVEHLFASWCATGTGSVFDRAAFLLRDWYRDNPQGAAGPKAWYNMSVGWRTMVYARAGRIMSRPAWLTEAIKVHGRWLVNNYGGVGNHALNTNRGLLAAGCFLRRNDWIDLAASRINTLLKASVDREGITNEQSVGYQQYNYILYTRARAELLACGRPEPTAFGRVRLMPAMLAHATLPNGEYELLGDTLAKEAKLFPGTPTEFTASRGTLGAPPDSKKVVYGAGFAFDRSGWGTERPYADELVFTLRFGPGRRLHGHHDGTSLTLYCFGSRLLLDAGKKSYEQAVWRTWFASRAAHNVVTVDGLTFNRSSTSMATNLGQRADLFTMTNGGYSGVSNRRTVVYSRRGMYLIVDDRLSSTSSHKYRQLWHLREGSDPLLLADGARTRSAAGNVEIRQLLGTNSGRILSGSTSPRQGWLSYEYEKFIPAPVVEQIKSGTSVRYITLLAPFGASPTTSAQLVQTWSDGYQLDVHFDGGAERISVRGTEVTVVDL
jgi:hypothetical protein